MDLRKFQKKAHQNSVDHGFWEDELNLGEKVALMHSELSELLEAYRNDPKAQCPKTMPDGSPIGLTLEEEEMADLLIRLCDLAQHRKVNLALVAQRKHDYNTTRPHKHGRKF